MKLTILGPQGSGKTVHAKLLSQKLNLPVIDVGQLIRNYCTTPEAKNREACKAMEQGELVPNDLAGNLLKNLIQNNAYENGFILDGYPRLLSQLEVFDPNVDKVIFIDVSEKTSYDRLKARGRVDDTPEGIKRRLAWYHEKTTKVLEYYRGVGKLIEVNGEDTTEKVFESIVKALNL